MIQKGFVFIVFLLISSSFSAKAQTNEKEAFQTFKKAREAFQNENYETSSKQLLKTKELLGSTNIRIQPMLIKSLVEIKDWRQAKIETTTYFGLNPDKELVEFQEIVNLEKNIKIKIYEEEQLYSSIKNSGSELECQSYLNEYPYGKYRTYVHSYLDENAWEKAKEQSSTAAYFRYLDKFPRGNHSSTAKEVISRWDKEAYTKAISRDTKEALNAYLNNYPRGKYRTVVKEKLATKKENLAAEKEKIKTKIYYLTKEAERDYEKSKGLFLPSVGLLIIGVGTLSAGIVGTAAKKSHNTLLTGAGVLTTGMSAFFLWHMFKSSKNYTKVQNEKRKLQRQLNRMSFETTLNFNGSSIGLNSTFGKKKKMNPALSPFQF